MSAVTVGGVAAWGAFTLFAMLRTLPAPRPAEPAQRPPAQPAEPAVRRPAARGPKPEALSRVRPGREPNAVHPAAIGRRGVRAEPCEDLRGGRARRAAGARRPRRRARTRAGRRGGRRRRRRRTGGGGRGGVGGRLRRRRAARRGAAAVIAVEAGALEDNAHRREHLLQAALAVRALGEGVVGELLHRLEALAALGALVLVGRHCLPPGTLTR